MREHRNAVLIRDLWSAINEVGAAAILDYCSPNYVRHEASRDYTRSEFMGVLAERFRAFPDSKTETLDLLVDGDRVAYRWVSQGTQTGEYRGISPSGRSIEASGLTITRIDEGKIIEEWALWNKSNVLEHLRAEARSPERSA